MVGLFRLPSEALQAKTKSIGRVVDSPPASVQYMGVDHRRADIFVTQQLLDPPNILPVLQEVGRIGVTRRASFTSATAEDGPPWLSAACAPKLQRRARLRVKKRKCAMEPGVFMRALFKSRKPGNTGAVPHCWDPHD